MNRAFCITMYQEFGTVDKTITNIKKIFPDSFIVLIQSTNHAKYIYPMVNETICLYDYKNIVEKHKIASHAISRNYSVGFTYLYNTNIQFDYIVALCGDTLVTDPTNFDRRYNDMKKQNKVACVSQAIGQDFHSADSNPANGISGGRYQFDGITDFMPQLFIIDGKSAIETKVFSDIKITNPFTSEQCLGDEFISKFGNFNVIKLARNAYDYKDGVIFQYKD